MASMIHHITQRLRPILLLLLTATIAVAGLFLLERQQIIETVKATNQRLVKLEAESLNRLAQQWSTQLLSLTSHESAQRLASLEGLQAMQSFREKRALETVFVELGRSREGYVHAIRFIDRNGMEQVVVRDGIVVTEYQQQSDRPFFVRAMALRPFQVGGSVEAELDGRKYIELSTPLSANGITSGVISMSIDVETFIARFKGLEQPANLSGVYLLDDKGDLLTRSLFAGYPAKNGSLLENILDRIKESPIQAPVLDIDGDIWGYIRSPQLGVYILFETSAALVNGNVKHQSFVLAVLLFGAMVIAFILRSGQTMSMPRLGNKNESDTHIRLRELSNITHEIRTPLNSMLGMLSLLRETKMSQKQYEYLDLATRSGEWLLELANELLDYSKLAEGKLKLENIDFNLRNTIRDVTEMLSIQAYQKGLEIACLVSSDVPERVVGDPTRIRQILINLIGNAVKFTDHGDIAISAKLVNADGNLSRVRIEVSDTGIGVDPEQQKEIFKEFKQGDASTARRHGGTGLGLTICQKLVEMMGGEIGVTDNANGGATFWFEVPYVIAKEEPQQAQMNNLEGHRVFIVGEIEGNRKTISSVLNKWGMVCDSSGDFEQANAIMKRAKAENIPFSVCLIDISLTSSSDKAFDLVRMINETRELEQTSVVILTAKGSPGDGQVARELGVKGYLTKPINRSDMKNTLAQVIAGSRQLTKPRMVTKHSLKEDLARETPKVLLVEDNPTNQKVLSGFLLRFGVEVDVAGNGLQAIDAVRKKVYDLVFMDIQLPEVDGIQAIQDIRYFEQNLGQGFDTVESGEPTMRTPIVAMSAAAQEADRRRALDVGADDFLLKPINMKMIEDTLVKWSVIKLDINIPSRFSAG